LIRVSQRLQEHYRAITRVADEFKKVYFRSPSNEELADLTNHTVKRIEYIQKVNNLHTVSLDSPVKSFKRTDSGDPSSRGWSSNNYDQPTTFEEILVNIPDDDQEDSAVKLLEKFYLRREMHKHLSKEDCIILFLRYGMVDADKLPEGFWGPLTFGQVASLLGQKPGRVRTRALRSLETLRGALTEDWIISPR